MLDVGWTELLVIGVVALLVIGPKDLPEMFRQLGRVTAKMRSMARDFQRAMDEAAKQAGVADVAKDLRNATSPKAMGMDAVKSAADKFEKWDPLKNTIKPTTPLSAPSSIKGASLTPPPMPATPTTPVAPAAATSEAAAAGPATQALYDKQAAKAAAYRDYSAKLKSIEEGGTPVASETPAQAPAKPRAAKSVQSVAATNPVAATAPLSKPARRSPAKKKADPV